MPSPTSHSVPLRWDVGVYAACAVSAAGLGTFTGLATHRAWAQLAVVGYAAATLVAFGQLLAHRRGAGWPGTAVIRGGLAVATWLATAVLPMLLLTVRPGGWAQAEVRVVERAGERWLATGSPYLGREAIAALPAGDQLAAYTPYQPLMALFGLPRALDGVAGWWSDARVWFTAVTLLTLGGAAWVLALCLLALAARERLGVAGLVVGAAALKLIARPAAEWAWPPRTAGWPGCSSSMLVRLRL